MSSILSFTASAAPVFSRQLTAIFLLLTLVAALQQPPTIGGAKSDPKAEDHRQDPSRTVTMLNRVTFNGSVKQENVDDWVVFFCVDWYEVCQGLWEPYRNTAVQWEKDLSSSASSWQSTAVRFAEVDCASDKVLCNENNVQYYPTVLHFRGGKVVKEWELSQAMFSQGVAGLSKHLTTFIGQELKDKLKGNTNKWRGKNGGEFSFFGHFSVFAKLISFETMLKDPMTAFSGYFTLILVVALVSWILRTGLELELKSMFIGAGKEATMLNTCAAVSATLPEMQAPRTIVRQTLEL